MHEVHVPTLGPNSGETGENAIWKKMSS